MASLYSPRNFEIRPVSTYHSTLQQMLRKRIQLQAMAADSGDKAQQKQCKQISSLYRLLNRRSMLGSKCTGEPPNLLTLRPSEC